MPQRVISREEFAGISANIIATYIQQRLATPVTLAETVAAGPFAWRTGMLRELKGFLVDEAIADNAFNFLKAQWEVEATRQGAPGMSVETFLNKVEVPTPPTAREIADAWEVESASSEEGKRQMYGPGGNPQALLDELRQQDEG